MIRLWISRTGPVPVRDQFGAQLLLGILSRQLPPGDRLPSVRELARRLKIHSNTVSSVYRDLAARGWVETRAGSGVFIRDSEGIRSFVRSWLTKAEALGYSREALSQELERSHSPAPAQSLAVADPDPELARILAAEIACATGRTVSAIGSGTACLKLPPDTLVLVNSGHREHVLPLLGGAPFLEIRLKSMQQMVAGSPRPSTPVLIAIVSRSARVRDWAVPLLSALGFTREAVLLRNPDEPGWRDGLQACGIVAADICSRDDIPQSLTPVTFHLIADDSLAEIRAVVTGEIVSQAALP